MIIIGVDFHPEFQQIALVDTRPESSRRSASGIVKRRKHSTVHWRARRCVKEWKASGHARWFERLLAELQFELWIGDAAEIRTKRQHSYRKYKIPCSTTSERRHLGRNRPTNLHCRLRVL